MKDELKCDVCGMPSGISDILGKKLVLQKDGRVLCFMCSDVFPIIDDSIKREMTKRSNDFSSFIDSSACMFNLDFVAVMLAVRNVFFDRINSISEVDKSLALKLIEDYAEDLMKLAKQIEDKNEVKNE